MTTETHTHPPLERRILLGVATLAAATLVALAASGSASAQGSGTPPAAPAPASVIGSPTVAVDTEDDSVRPGESTQFLVTVRNDTSAPLTGAALEINVDNEFTIDSVTSGGPKDLFETRSDQRIYTLGTLQPGQQVQFTVHGEFRGSDINRNDLNDHYDFRVDVFSAAGIQQTIAEVELQR